MAFTYLGLCVGNEYEVEVRMMITTLLGNFYWSNDPDIRILCHGSPLLAPRIVVHHKHNRPLGALIQPIQRRHVLPVEIEAVHIRVQANPIRIVTFGEGHKPPLKTPSDEDLVRGDTVLLSNLHQRGVVRFLVAHDGAVCLDDYRVVLAVANDIFLLAPRVQLQVMCRNVRKQIEMKMRGFDYETIVDKKQDERERAAFAHEANTCLPCDVTRMVMMIRARCGGLTTHLKLVDMGWPHLTHPLQLLNVANPKVAYANGPGLAFLVQSLQGEPHVPALFGAAPRRMDEKQVDIASGDLVYTLQAGGVVSIDRAGDLENFGRDEDVVAWEARLRDGLANFLLVAVILRGVDMAVACFQGGQARSQGALWWGEVRAEA